MGGLPSEGLLAVALSSDTWAEKGWVDAFLSAVAREAERWSVSICGGDISSSGASSDLFSLTITGWVERERLTPRSAASPGDLLYVTGELGGSFESGRHLRFNPRLEEARFLSDGFAGAIIDISDGLTLDAARIAEKSGVGALIDASRVPVAGGATLEQALSEGEDYELLFSVSSGESSVLEDSWPFDSVRLTRIGVFTEKRAEVRPAPGEIDVASAAVKGYTHFSE